MSVILQIIKKIALAGFWTCGKH